MPSYELGPYTPGGIVPSRIYGLGRSVARLYEQRRLNSGPRFAQSGIDRKLGSGFKPVAARRLSFGPAMPVTAGATNVIQRAVVKQRSGKRVKRKSLNYLYKLQKAAQSVCILRWQAMTPYDNDGALECGYRRNSSPYLMNYPVYIFDLTSCKLNAQGTPLAAKPMYRLISDSTGAFNWDPVNGLEPNGTTATEEWIAEAGRGNSAVNNTPNMGLNSMLSWSDIRLTLYGATKQSTRFNVSFIQFTDEVYHPNAFRQAPTPGATTTPLATDVQGRFNAAMEELVKPLVFHPMHSAGNATNVFRILQNRSFVVQPDTQTNEAKAAPNVCLKHFKRMNRICKWNWETSDSKVTSTSTEVKLDPAAAPGLDSNAAFNQFFGGQKKPYVHPNARVYMMITAQAYIRSGIQPDGTTNVATTIENTPRFDIMVRNKWIYDAV